MVTGWVLRGILRRVGERSPSVLRLSDGTSSQLILENVSQFAWSPDAAYLAVVSDTKLYLLTVGGVNQGVLTEALDETQPVSWLSTTLIRYTNEDTAYLVTTSGVSFGVMDTTDASWTLPTNWSENHWIRGIIW
jgi:hypothetical protein